jgi:hypothetical protein
MSSRRLLRKNWQLWTLMFWQPTIADEADMTLRPGETPGRAIAVFPFLKTTQPIPLGAFTIRSTDDTAGLEAEDALHVREIAGMLFLQDDLRIRSGTYALLPALDLDRPEPEPCLRQLEQIQAVVAYCYSAPHPTFGTPFFHFEQASLAVFSPEPVTTFLVRPDHHVEPVDENAGLTPDEWHRVPGYQGRYNLRQPFWVTKGSRLYPPVPHLGLNIAQNLGHDLDRDFTEGPQHQLLPALLRKPATETSERVLTAIGWYNRANSLASDDSAAIIHLAVAFETLLGLPRDAKTDRFVDAVSLLLGRVPRLNLWAGQFYDARCDVAHEGKTERFRFILATKKNSADGPQYQALLTYGRQIFQLCVGTLLFGALLGERAGLRDKLVTNQERFVLISKTLDDESLPVADRFAAIDDTVALIDEFRFVGETGLLLETMIGAAQRAARNLLQCGDLEPPFKERVEALAGAPRSRDWYEALEALQVLHDFKAADSPELRSPQWMLRRLIEVVWGCTFRHYFWLREQRGKVQPAG